MDHHNQSTMENTTLVEESTPSKSKSRRNHHRRSTSWNNMMYGYSSNGNNNSSGNCCNDSSSSAVPASAAHLNLPELKPNEQKSNAIMINRIPSRNYNNNSHINIVNSNSMMLLSARNKDAKNQFHQSSATSTSRSPGGKKILRWTTMTTSIMSKTKKHPILIAICFGMILIYWFCTITVAFARVGNNPSLTMSDNGNNNPNTSSDNNNNNNNSNIASVAPPGLIRGVGAGVVSSSSGGGGGGISSSHSIPLPLPKQLVSVVLMNFSRPRMIRESSMMRTLLSHPNIDEVLLLHANPKAAFEFVHPKVVNIDAVEHNDEMGLSLRFYFCQLAKHPWVIHLDDDMEFTSEALNELLIEYGRNPHRIVGRFGRDLTPGNSFQGYNSKDRHKSTEVILTKLMVVERDICSSFFEYAHLVWDFILSGDEGPLWNGEDIFMSLVANHVYNQKQRKDIIDDLDGNNHGDNNNREGENNISDQHEEGLVYNNYAMDWLNVWQADDSLKDYKNGKNDISGGLSGYKFWDWRWWQSLLRRNRHYSYRGKLWQIARDRLNGLNDE